jgi:hypothetical protein
VSSAPLARRFTSIVFAPASSRSARLVSVVSIGWYVPSAARKLIRSSWICRVIEPSSFLNSSYVADDRAGSRSLVSSSKLFSSPGFFGVVNALVAGFVGGAGSTMPLPRSGARPAPPSARVSPLDT